MQMLHMSFNAPVLPLFVLYSTGNHNIRLRLAIRREGQINKLAVLPITNLKHWGGFPVEVAQLKQARPHFSASCLNNIA